MKKKKKVKSKQLVMEESLKREAKMRQVAELTYLEDMEFFDHFSPPCISCGSFGYSACNTDEDSNVIECDKCPLIKILN